MIIGQKILVNDASGDVHVHNKSVVLMDCVKLYGKVYTPFIVHDRVLYTYISTDICMEIIILARLVVS